jgi:Flp pilus assembly protein CpaB
MTYRLRNILIALGLAAAAAVLVSAYVTQYKSHVEKGQSAEQVYVATRDIPTGTPGDEVISGGYLRKDTAERRNVVRGAISDPKQIARSYVTVPIYSDEQISLRHFGQVGTEGLRGQITGSQRAIQLDASASQVMAGSLKTGDHVDVVGTWALPEGSPHHVSKVVLRDILVLDTPETGLTRTGVGSSSNQTVTVQLRVTDSQSAKLLYLIENGKWTLTLRPPTRAGDSSESIDDAKTIAADSVKPSIFGRVSQGAK